MKQYGFVYGPGPATPGHIVLFISHLYSKGQVASTIATKLSALSYFYKLAGSHDIVQHFLVQKCLSGVRKLASSQDSRMPITVPMLNTLMNNAGDVTKCYYHKVMLRAMMSLSFYAFLRPGEVTQSPNNLMFSNIQIHDSQLVLTFVNFKHHVGKPVTLSIPAQQGPTCPVMAIKSYISERGNAPGPLFCSHSQYPITYHKYHEWFHQLVRASSINLKMNLHSFRIGAASLAAANGVSSTLIQQMGRWRSTAYVRYIRIPQIKLFG